MDIAKRYYKRNAIIIFLDPALFTIGMTFLSITAVIPYFLIKLGANNFQISIASVFVSLGMMLPQLFIARKIRGLEKKGRLFTVILMIQRLFFLIYSLMIPFFVAKSPGVSVNLFLISWGIFCFFTGTYGPFYFGIMTKVIPYEKRGEILGYSYAFSSVIALIASYVLNVYLNNIKYPLNYSFVFDTGAIFLILDALLFWYIKEPPDIVEKSETGIGEFFKEIPAILKNNREFRNLVISFVFIVISAVSLSYYAVYATRSFNASPSDIAAFTAISMAVNVLSNVILGRISIKLGHKAVLLFSSIMGVFAAISVLMIHSMIGIFIAFAMSTIMNTGYGLSSGILISKNIKQNQISFYIAINNTITLLFQTIMFLISSKLIDKFGFVSIFLVSLVFAALALLHLWFRVKEV